MPSVTQLMDADITLRPFRIEDSVQLHEAVQESLKELEPWMSWATENYTELTAREYITITRARWEEHTLFAFAITRDHEIVGGCTLSSIHPVYHYCNVGYWVRTSCHGRGIAGRAAKLAVRFGFENVGLIRAEIVVAVGNFASVRVAEKIGAHYEGILLNRMVVGKSIYNAHMYSLLPSDFGLVARL
ncbi:MAG: GNAT family N-acetyltransferase [Anaerolineae bacterium]|nr:GNAT family N-acetyltransferase [Anaerolineae bacterium]